MPGPIIYSGTNSPKYTENWDKIFGKKVHKSATQVETKEKEYKDMPSTQATDLHH